MIDKSNRKKNLFDEISEDYEAMSKLNVGAIDGSNQYLSRYKVEFAQDLVDNPSRILDYGCGVGMSISHLEIGFPNATIDGYDPSTNSIKKASESHKNVTFYTKSNLLAQAEYDLVFVSCVLHHITPNEVDDSLATMLSLIKESGYLLIFEHNPLNPLTQLVVANSPIDKDAQLIRRSKLVKSLYSIDNSLKILSGYTVFFPDFLQVLRPLEKSFLSKLPMGAQYFILAQKGQKP